MKLKGTENKRCSYKFSNIFLPSPEIKPHEDYVLMSVIYMRPKDHSLFLYTTRNNQTKIDLPGADKSLARPTSRYILFDGENISFDASLVIYI
jgi:hypothetical protein